MLVNVAESQVRVARVVAEWVERSFVWLVRLPPVPLLCGLVAGFPVVLSLSRKYWERGVFDIRLSTEDNYCQPHFTGTNADVRPLLDYSFHGLYSKKRMKVQDELIQKLFDSSEANHLQNDLPWVVFTAGAMGAGKGHVMKWMDSKGYISLERFIVIDPDQMRQALPEWKSYVKYDVRTAADMTQKEAGCIAEIVGYRALRARCNVIFDGSLKDVSWYKRYFIHLREHFPGIRIMIIHILAERKEVLERARNRAKETGREVPVKALEASLDAVPKSVSELMFHADFVCRVRNSSGREPQLEREPQAPHPGKQVEINWGVFQQLWNPVDADGDGFISKEEIKEAISEGLLTEEVVASIDYDHTGMITKEEIDMAKETAFRNGTAAWK